MLRLFLILLSCMSFSVEANAQSAFSFCGENTLQLDFISDDPSLGAANVAEIHGALEIPHPGYLYSLIFKEMDSEGVVYGVLTLEDTGGENPAVISEIDIKQGVDVPYGASKVVIEVVKSFNWGPTHFEAKVNRRETVCLKAREE